jgi:hypothetical protein
MSKEYSGVLEAQSETGTEGIIWCLYTGDFTKREWSYENLVVIEPGDYLKILNYTRKILWEGVVKYSRTSFSKVVGEDKTISPERWAKFFFNQHSAILIKKNE